MIPRHYDYAWIRQRVEVFHRRRLIDAGIALVDAGRVYRNDACQRAMEEEVCYEAATFLAEMSALPAEYPAMDERRLPTPDRQLFARAGQFALNILRRGLFREEPGVTATETAVYAGWQLIWWEGGKPLGRAVNKCVSTQELEAANTAAAQEIDASMENARTQMMDGLPWDEVRESVDWEAVAQQLYCLYMCYGACGEDTPARHAADKLCHCADFSPVPLPPQVPEQ